MAAKTEKQRRADRAASRRRRRKQNFITFLVLVGLVLVLILLLMHNCGKNAASQETTTSTGVAASTAPAPQTTISATTAPTQPAHEITEEDGFTYIDGVLVVNKSYAIPADYNPGGLTDECSAAFNEMVAAAEADGMSLWVSSDFRSYEEQTEIYDGYVYGYGQEEADRFSARPGHSEHQTGLAIDLNGVSDTFGETPEGQWVAEHCAEYGFILRYPEDKEEETGYMYEPWHIRYVGEEFAQKLVDSGLCLEEYFGITSEYEESEE